LRQGISGAGPAAQPIHDATQAGRDDYTQAGFLEYPFHCFFCSIAFFAYVGVDAFSFILGTIPAGGSTVMNRKGKWPWQHAT
jgi:hypothetical protein